MKRILTLMVMTLLVATVPQKVFSNSTSKDDKGGVYGNYPVYANKAPNIIDNGLGLLLTDYVYDGQNLLIISCIKNNAIKPRFSFEYVVDCDNELGKYVGKNLFEYEDAGPLSLLLLDSEILKEKSEHLRMTIYFSNETVLIGNVLFSGEDLMNYPDNFLDDDQKKLREYCCILGLTGEFNFEELGNEISPAVNNLKHYQYVSNLFKNYNITKIILHDYVNKHDVIIPIDVSKWGSKYTFDALFKAVAKESGNYEVFGLTAPASSGSSYSSSSSSSSSTTSTPSYSSSSSRSTYSTSSSGTYSTPSYNYSYKPEPKKRFWGFSAGYVQKQWQSKEGGSKEKMGFWEDSKVVHGVQAGFRATPYFKFGLGLNTGLLYEYYYTKSQPMVVDGYDVYGEMQEHALYMPVHLTYRLKFNDFHIYAFGGVGLDYGIMSKVQLKENGSDYVGYDNSPLYETEDAPDWKRFNASYEFGGGLRYKMVELQFTMSRGFLNMSHDSSYKLYQNKPMMFSLGFMF